MDQYRTIPPSFSLYFGASNSWIPNLMVLRTRTGSILGCPWNLVTILSKLGCNLLRRLIQPIYIGLIIYLLSSMDILVPGVAFFGSTNPPIPFLNRQVDEERAQRRRQTPVCLVASLEVQPWQPFMLIACESYEKSPHFFISGRNWATSSKIRKCTMFFSNAPLVETSRMSKNHSLGTHSHGKPCESIKGWHPITETK